MAKETIKKPEEVTTVALSENRHVATIEGSSLPKFMEEDLEKFAGAGNSEDGSDSALPFLGILQSGSPQVKEEDPKYIIGARAGFLLNTASKQLWPSRQGKQEEGIVAIPCYYTKKWVEWKPNRGGYAATHDFDLELIKKLGARKTKVVVEGKEREQITLPSGNYLVETAYTFLVADGAPMVIGASSSALGPMREWMYQRKMRRVRGREVPSFSFQYRLQTVLQTKGENSWYNWKISEVGPVLEADQYTMAKEFYKACAAGTVQMGRPDYFDDGGPSEERVGSEAAANSRRGDPDEDDSIPV